MVYLRTLNEIPDVNVTKKESLKVSCDESFCNKRNKQEDKKGKSKVVDECSNDCSSKERKKRLSKTWKVKNNEWKQNFKKLMKERYNIWNQRIIMSRIKIASILVLHMILKIEFQTNY